LKLVDNLLIQKDLTSNQARRLFRLAFDKKREVLNRQKKILTLLQKKGVHSHELTAVVQVVQDSEKRIRFRHLKYLVDGCGTGGDGMNTFNISTLSCLVAAASGAKVAKHGNKSVTSMCGSSDILSALGVRIDAPLKTMLRMLKYVNFCYFHAPLYHPFFARAQRARLELAEKKIKTIFNLIGPLVNPLRVKQQLVGVYRKDFALMIAKAAQHLNFRHLIILWNKAGYDEITTIAPTLLLEVRKTKLTQKWLFPKSYGFKKGQPLSLRGGSRKMNVMILKKIIAGKEISARRNTVLLNSGALLYVSGKSPSIRSGIDRARRAIDTLKAQQLLKDVIRFSHDT
jgi:anthranilate phosphoribosyltransferase